MMITSLPNLILSCMILNSLNLQSKASNEIYYPIDTIDDKTTTSASPKIYKIDSLSTTQETIKTTPILKNNNKDGDGFDLYVLCMSYQPEFCYENKGSDYYYCENPEDTWRYNLTIHGLWPEYSDGGYPSYCTDEAFSEEAVVGELGICQMETLWVNVKTEAFEEGYTELWEHEWSKHGTCSGMDQTTYFNETLGQSLKTPELVSSNYGGSVSKTDLVDAYGGPSMVAIVCNSGKYLSEVRACVGMESGGILTGRIECPQHVLDEDNCTDELVYIDKFYVDEEEAIIDKNQDSVSNEFDVKVKNLRSRHDTSIV